MTSEEDFKAAEALADTILKAPEGYVSHVAVVMARAFVESRRPSSNWRPISEANLDGTHYDVWVKPDGSRVGYRVVNAHYSKALGYWCKDGGHNEGYGYVVKIDHPITHFQPLPSPPLGDGEARAACSIASFRLSNSLVKKCREPLFVAVVALHGGSIRFWLRRNASRLSGRRRRRNIFAMLLQFLSLQQFDYLFGRYNDAQSHGNHIFVSCAGRTLEGGVRRQKPRRLEKAKQIKRAESTHYRVGQVRNL